VTVATSGMRVRIHRGAREIGGNCVELESDGRRLVLDVGRPLDAGFDDEIGLPGIEGLDGREGPTLEGVVLSHPHQDHYGLVGQVGPSVPIYVGRGAASILDAAAFFSRSGVALRPVAFLSDRRPIEIGPFTVTPYLVDHSAFDSYALVVAAGGRRVFYSGDFRAHGRKASLVTKLCEQPPEGIDVLILEGTHVRPDGCEVPGLDESELELALAEEFLSTTGLVAAFSSTQNIDRLVTIYRACKRASRTLVIDLYAASVAAATATKSIPQIGFPRLRVYVPNRQRILVKDSSEFERVKAIRGSRVFLEEIRASAGDFVMLMQGSTLPEVARAGCLEEASAIWSLWPGYLDQPSGKHVLRTLDEHGVPLRRMHASGHARIADLQALADALAPARVVPIHSAAPERFTDLFARVERHPDGEWWEA
jgi:ribonuclease J